MLQNKKLIGALVAAALAIATFYGLIGQKTATTIQNQADQTLGTTPADQQPAPSTQAPTAPDPAPTTPSPPPQR